MKKVFLLIISLLFTTVIVSCQNDTLHDKVFKENLISYSSSDNENRVTRNITLALSSNTVDNVVISWISNNESVITIEDNIGKVTRPNTDTIVTLTAKVIIDNVEKSKQYQLKVIKAVQSITYVETFDNLPDTGTSYTQIEFTGVDNIKWQVYGSRSDLTLNDSKALTLSSVKDGSKITGEISGGISHFSVDIVKAFDNTYERKVELLINGESKGTFTVDAESFEVSKFTINNINVSGTFTLELKHLTGREKRAQIIIDNLTWTTYGGDSIIDDYPNTDDTKDDSSTTEDTDDNSSTEFTGYYASLNGKSGSALKKELERIISTGVKYTKYENTSNYFVYIDADPMKSGNILLVYNRASVNGEWDGGNTWNKEHVWPQSKLGNAHKGDLHNLRAANRKINEDRGNLPYVDGKGTCGKINGAWFPGEEDKGDIARIVFYMNTRWNLSITKSTIGDLNTFIEWHKQDPVDDFERHRNEEIYRIQKNRNPYIDHPELVEMIYGSGYSRLSLTDNFLFDVMVLTIEIDTSSLYRKEYIM